MLQRVEQSSQTCHGFTLCSVSHAAECQGSLRAQQSLRTRRAAGQGLQPHSTAPIGVPSTNMSQHSTLPRVELSASALCDIASTGAHLVVPRALPAPAAVLRGPAVRVAAAAAPVPGGAAVAAALAAPAVPRRAAGVAAAAASGTGGPGAPPPAVLVGWGPAVWRARVAPLALQLPAAGGNNVGQVQGREPHRLRSGAKGLQSVAMWGLLGCRPQSCVG